MKRLTLVIITARGSDINLIAKYSKVHVLRNGVDDGVPLRQ